MMAVAPVALSSTTVRNYNLTVHGDETRIARRTRRATRGVTTAPPRRQGRLLRSRSFCPRSPSTCVGTVAVVGGGSQHRQQLRRLTAPVVPRVADWTARMSTSLAARCVVLRVASRCAAASSSSSSSSSFGSSFGSSSSAATAAGCGVLHPPPLVPAPVFQLAAAVASRPSTPPPPPAPALDPVFAASTAGKVLFGLLAAGVAAVLAACVAGFLVAVRELVRACREATIASRTVAACAENINVAAAALKDTMVKADQLLDNVGSLGTTTASVLETATREAGVLQRRLSDLPNTASRTLMEAITQQYSLPSGSYDRDKPVDGVWAGGVRIEIGAVVEGGRAGASWSGGAPGSNFSFNRSNRFRTGEYCAVPRTDQTYTWGVIELNDESYSVDEGPDEDIGLACEWPPRDPDEVNALASGGGGDGDGRPAAGGEQRAGSRVGWFERRLAAAAARAGPERAERVESWFRTITGLTDMDEREYKVVVELDTNVYKFKTMSAGDLGKRV